MNEIILGIVYIIVAVMAVYLTLNRGMNRERFVKMMVSILIMILVGLYIPPKALNIKNMKRRVIRLPPISVNK